MLWFSYAIEVFFKIFSSSALFRTPQRPLLHVYSPGGIYSFFSKGFNFFQSLILTGNMLQYTGNGGLDVKPWMSFFVGKHIISKVQ